MNARIEPIVQSFHEAAEKARRQRLARHAALSQARGLVRDVGLVEEREYMAALQNIHASSRALYGSRQGDWNARLLELITDFDKEMYEPDPELSAIDPRNDR